MTRSSSTCIAAIAAAASLHTCHAFVLPSSTYTSSSSCVTQSPSFYAPSITVNTAASTSTTLFLSSTTTTSSNTLSLQLQKPLGLILEESDSTNPTNCGVIVTQVNEGGSAYASPSADKLTNAKITKVMETDVSSMNFDDVMDVIIGAPESLVVEFALAEGVTVKSAAAPADGQEDDNEESTVEEYEIGTTVTITVEQPNNPNKPTITLQAQVGDNLRKTLLANNDIELYRGLKKKLGNCGGGGQCGFCAVELEDDSESGMVWGERSEYEDGRIGKRVGTEKQRLACMNNVLGPATVKTL